MPLILDYLFKYRFLTGVWLSSRLGNEDPQWGKPLHSAGINTCLLFIYIHLSYFLPIYGIISQCPIYQIQTASNSSIDTSIFWSASRTSPKWEFNSSLSLFQNNQWLKRDRPTSWFRFKFTSLNRNAGVPQYLLKFVQLGWSLDFNLAYYLTKYCNRSLNQYIYIYILIQK